MSRTERRGRRWDAAAAAAALAGASSLAYAALVRPWHLRWGATDDEVARPLPGDAIVADPIVVTNRAVTVRARPEEIWPWLAQMGELPRGGFYSYEGVERLLGMKVSNADRILRRYQRLEVGDALDRAGTMCVQAVEPERFVVLGPPEGPDLASTWSINLLPVDGEQTRLVSRVRARIDRWTPGTALLVAVLDPGQFVMERKWLLEVRKRAEAAAERRHERFRAPVRRRPAPRRRRLPERLPR